MTRKRGPYKTYTKEFKAEAVRLMQASDRPASEIAQNGIATGSGRLALSARDCF